MYGLLWLFNNLNGSCYRGVNAWGCFQASRLAPIDLSVQTRNRYKLCLATRYLYGLVSLRHDAPHTTWCHSKALSVFILSAIGCSTQTTNKWFVSGAVLGR